MKPFPKFQAYLQNRNFNEPQLAEYLDADKKIGEPKISINGDTAHKKPKKGSKKQKSTGLASMGDKKLVFNYDTKVPNSPHGGKKVAGKGMKNEEFLARTKNMSDREFTNYMLENCTYINLNEGEELPLVTAYAPGGFHPHPPEAIKYVVVLADKNESILNSLVHSIKESGSLGKFLKAALDHNESYDEICTLLDDNENGDRRCGCLARAMEKTYQKSIDDQFGMFEAVSPPIGMDDEEHEDHDESDDENSESPNDQTEEPQEDEPQDEKGEHQSPENDEENLDSLPDLGGEEQGAEHPQANNNGQDMGLGPGGPPNPKQKMQRPQANNNGQDMGPGPGGPPDMSDNGQPSPSLEGGEDQEQPNDSSFANFNKTMAKNKDRSIQDEPDDSEMDESPPPPSPSPNAEQGDHFQSNGRGGEFDDEELPMPEEGEEGDGNIGDGEHDRDEGDEDIGDGEHDRDDEMNAEHNPEDNYDNGNEEGGEETGDYLKRKKRPPGPHGRLLNAMKEHRRMREAMKNLIF